MRPGAMVADIGLGVVFALGIAFTAYMLITSWGKAYWAYDSAVAVVVCALALLCERRKVWTAPAGVTVTAAATVVSLVADWPQEPAPVTALALAVLVGSSLRTLPAWPAAAITAGGVMVIMLAWLSGPNGVAALATAALAGGLVLGPALRLYDKGRRARGSVAWPT
jgi:hypothetical protein